MQIFEEMDGYEGELMSQEEVEQALENEGRSRPSQAEAYDMYEEVALRICREHQIDPIEKNHDGYVTTPEEQEDAGDEEVADHPTPKERGTLANDSAKLRPRVDGSPAYSCRATIQDLTLDQDQKRFAQWAQHCTSFRDLTNALLLQEQSDSNTSVGTRDRYFQTGVYMMLLTTHVEVLHALIRGDLPYQYHHNPTVAAVLDGMWDQANKMDKKFDRGQPVIYIQHIADENGIGLDHRQLWELVTHLREYCQRPARPGSQDWIFQVDTRRRAS